MPHRDSNATTVYVVIWPRDSIVKVGRTILPSRVRKFVIRGAIVHRLIFDALKSDESAVLSLLRNIGTPAFDSWQQSVPWLGAGGTGFSECYRVGERLSEFLDVFEAAYPKAEAA